MKEQIEEMRKDLIEIFDEEYEKRRMITPDFAAEKMTAKGYRKQINAVWVARICEFSDGTKMVEEYYCSNCFHEEGDNDKHFCPNCGAKMKGGAE